jgi:signal transduction histidine kinase
LLLAAPALHPLLLPIVGVPSHLLWWVHVLPVALVTFRGGRRAAVAVVAVSLSVVSLGELTFGAGYGTPATTETVVALSVALTATNLLVAAFALYAREVSGRYRLLFDRVRVAIFQVGARGRITGMNPAALALVGATDDDWHVGRPITGVLCPKGLESVDHLDRLGAWTGQLEVEAPSGTKVIHALVASTVDPDTGRRQIIVGDRSVEVLQEQEIDRQAKLAALGEALAGVAHELNNPLGSIMAFAELGSLDAPEGSEVQESFGTIQHEARRMRSIVGELLGFSRRSDERPHTELGAVVRKMLRVQRIALGKSVPIEEDITFEGVVAGAESKIQQVLLNLISNAAFAVGAGNGGRITVSVTERDGSAEVEVRDDGPGIDPVIADQLFEPFTTTKPEGEGTGLGLAISRRLARSWGGDLTLQNVEPHGAAFTLTLPLAVEPSSTDLTGGAADRVA